jgi:hypothetical protein
MVSADKEFQIPPALFIVRIAIVNGILHARSLIWAYAITTNVILQYKVAGYFGCMDVNTDVRGKIQAYNILIIKKQAIK